MPPFGERLSPQQGGDEQMTKQHVRIGLWAFVLVALVVAGLAGWVQFRQARAGYDAYRARIQQGVRIAGVDVGWHTPDEARDKVWKWIVEPYYRNYALYYLDQTVTLSPGDDLGLDIPVDDMVAEAMAASHQYDYWQGFKLWVQGQAETLNLDVPFRLSFDESAAARFLTNMGETYDVAATEPMVDVEGLTFIPGHAGHFLDVKVAAAQINERVTHPEQREVTLPITTVEPDQSPARIESMLSTLGPVMERPPTPPYFYTATIPISTTGGLQGTPLVTYTGELTWTFPYFASYTGPLTRTTGFFFDPGKPGYTFNVATAVRQVEQELEAGASEPITFEAELVAPPPVTPALLLPPLKARLAEFPGVSSILVKNLDTGEMIYNSNTDYVMSGMSVVKVGIMVEVYRYYGGKVDEQTHQELLDMLGSSSCNPCANRLLAAVGNGSSTSGANKVTSTMHGLGLKNFYLCSPFQIVDYWDNGTNQNEIVWTANSTSWQPTGLQLTKAPVPRYDRCVRATPREMADLLEMIYLGTQNKGLLLDTYPKVFSPEVCQDMIDIMASNDLRNMLGAGIPDWVKLAHKHGFAGYDVPWGDTRAEVGLVFSPEATWLVSFYIWEDTPWIDFGINQPLYRDVSNMLYNYFNPNQPFWPLPQWAPTPEAENTSDSGT
jgi:hypothetical protein